MNILQTMDSLCSPPKLRRMITIPEMKSRPLNQMSTPQHEAQRATAPMMLNQSSFLLPNPAGVYPTMTSPVTAAEAPDGNPALQRPWPVVDSTPRQTHTLFPATPNSHTESPSGDFEQQLIDRAVGDLPTVFSEVFTMQKGQTTEIHRLQKQIQVLKEKLAEGEERRDEVQMELKSVVSKTYLIGEAIVDKHKACKQLSKEMSDMVKEENDLQRKLSRAEEDKEADLRLLNTHRRKKSEYAESVRSHEELHSTIYRELQDTTRRLAQLNAQKAKLEASTTETDKLLSGELETELQSDIATLNCKTQVAIDEGKEKGMEILAEKQKQKQLEQGIQVMHKRNAAQLTRLKRQLKDVQQRNRHWQNQISQLEDKITQATTQLEN